MFIIVNYLMHITEHPSGTVMRSSLIRMVDLQSRPEFEIVGAFSSDRLQIQNIISGDGNTAGQVVTVTTAVPHQLSGGTPIKIEGVNDLTYNISTKVQNVLNETQFTYLPFVPPNLKASPAGGLSAGSAEVSVEVDTVTGASPYIFNIC